MKKLLFTLMLIFIVSVFSHAQDRYTQLRNKLQTLVTEMPGLEESVQVSISGASLQEFLSSLAENHKLNLSVDPSLDVKVFNNFSDANVTDVLIFVCRQYNLEIEFTGTILYFKKFIEPIIPIKPYEPKKPKIDYAKETNFLSLDLKKDSLEYVVREITERSFQNVILSPNAKGMQVSVFIQNRPFENALEMMCMANGLRVVKKGENFYSLEKDENPVADTKNKTGNSFSSRTGGPTQGLEIKSKGDLLSVRAENVAIKDIIREVSNEMLINYFVYTEPQGNTSLYVENATYDDFLSYLLTGTTYTHKIQDSIYLIGDRKLEGLRKTTLVRMKYRPIEKIVNYIPAELKKDVEITEFLELNGLVISGSSIRIDEIEKFIQEIDQVVPMVSIEVIIIDSKKSRVVTTGIEMGLNSSPNTTTTNGSVSPGVNLELSPASVNDIINGFNGLGIMNLGNVSPNFYVSLQALEENGNIKIKSTPRISTINGNQASLKVGSQEYYLEQTSNIYATTNTQTVVTNNYKSVNADLSIKIKPFVSQDNQVTLSVTVDQSDFTGKISPTAPPGTVSRTFESVIRVKDGEMIILGGLEEKSVETTSTGLPLLSRIPILRSIFGKTNREKATSQLTVFIKPTIIY
ncbi:MAG: type II secretion system protein GspD [Bacteroidota bacterium]